MPHQRQIRQDSVREAGLAVTVPASECRHHRAFLGSSPLLAPACWVMTDAISSAFTCRTQVPSSS